MAPRSSYKLDQSPLYRLSSQRKLCELLNVSRDELSALTAGDSYHVFVNAKSREIQHPIARLDQVHATLAKLLSRIDLPGYVHSRKGRSYVSNAAAHAWNSALMKTDIARFYPNTPFSAVFGLFSTVFRCPPDVAYELTCICTYQQRHLPTGSAISGYLAFLAFQPAFDEIAELARMSGCTMTLYVDDIVISGASASRSMLNRVRQILRRYGLNTKALKSFTLPARKAKIVTGVAIGERGLAVPNERLRRSHQLRKQVRAASNAQSREALMKSIAGYEQESTQIRRHIDGGRVRREGNA